MADLQPVIFPAAQETVVTIVNDSGSIIVQVPETAPIIATPVETYVVVDTAPPVAPEVVVIEQPASVTLVEETPAEIVVVVVQEEMVVITGAAGPMGPPGPSGADGQDGEDGQDGNTTLSGIAGETLSGHRAVRLRGSRFFYADQNNASHGESLFGITTAAALTNAAVTAQYSGRMTFSGWGWIIGEPVFVTGVGQLTQSPPEEGEWVRQIGVATDTNAIFIDLGPTIYLG